MMTEIFLSANEVFKSLDKQLKKMDDKKIKDEVDEIIENNKSAGSVDFSQSASRTSKPEWLDFFINLIYNLMEVDNKYGRMAACNIFRKLCPVLSAQQVMNCLSFIIEFNDNDADSEHSGSESDEYEEIPSGDEDEEMLSDNEEDEDSNSDKETDDDDNLNLSSLEALKENMMSSSELGDINLDDVPEDELKQYDVRLEKLMKAFHGKIPEAKEFQHRELSQKNIRSRGCDLLKVLIKEAVNPTHLIVLVVPLIEAIETERDGEIKQILCKLCADLVVLTSFKQSDDSTVELVGRELKKLFSTPHDRSGAIWSSSIRFLIKTGEQATNITESRSIFDTVACAMDDFFTVKESPITPKILNTVLLLMRNDFIPICDIIRKHSFSKGGKSIKKNVGLNLLIKAYQEKPRMLEVSPGELKEFQESVSSNILKILNSIITPNKIKATYLLDLFKLMKIIYSLHKKNPVCLIGFDWTSIKPAMIAFGARFSDGKLSRSIAKSFSGTANALQIKQARIIGKKNKSNQKEKQKTKGSERDNILKSKNASSKSQKEYTEMKRKPMNKQKKHMKTSQKKPKANRKNKHVKH